MAQNELQLLESEIARLKKKARELENEIDLRMDYFGENYKTMTIKSLLPTFLARSATTGTILDLLWENRRFRVFMNNLSDMLFDKLSDGVELLKEKLGRKKHKD